MFRNTNEALRWSFMINATDTTQMSSVNMMAAKKLSSSVNPLVSDLSKGEAIAQAVNIINDVRCLSNKAEAACLMVEYGRDYFGKDTDYLASILLSRNGWEDKRLEGVKMLVRNCLGHKMSSHDMVCGLKCGYEYLNQYRDKVSEYLDKLSGAAYDSVGAVLKHKNIVGV